MQEKVTTLRRAYVAQLLVGILLVCASNASNAEDPGFEQKGTASFYANSFHGKTTANGEKYNQNAYTAAHRELAFGTRVQVTNIANGKTVTVRINDRGPFARGRVIDLSKTAFEQLGDTGKGLLKVKLEAL